MTDKKISQLTPIAGADMLDSDELVVARESTSENFSVTRAELLQGSGVVVDDDFTSNGLLKRTAEGVYGIAVEDTDYQGVPAEGPFVDGDKTKLDGIETGADVTDTANVTAAGALMDSELTDIAALKALNQGVATTDNPTFAGATIDDVLHVSGGDTEEVRQRIAGAIELYDKDGATRAYGYFSQDSGSAMIGGNQRLDKSVTTGTHIGYSKGTNARGGSGIVFEATADSDYGEITFVQNNDTNDDTWDVVEPAYIDAAGDFHANNNLTVDGSVSVTRNYATRSAFVTAVAGGLTAPNGTEVTAGGYRYKASSSATDISDLTGWVPVGPVSSNHFDGDVGDLVAYLASASDRSRLALATTVNIPTDAATLQTAINALGETVEGDAIVLNIESAHSPTTGISVSYGNYSGYQITSTDASVSVGAFTGDLVKAVDAQAPRLSAKFIANGQITLTLTGAVTVVAGETVTQATTGANGVAISNGSVSELVLSTLDGGSFNNTNQLSGSTSGALGSNSVPTNIAPVSIVNGYWLEGNSHGRVDAGCGVDYCYDSGLVCYEGGKAHAQSAVFNFAARSAKVSFGTSQPIFNSAAHAWGAGSSIYGEGIQGNDSGYYGVQASHGATAIYRNSDSQRAWRHGIRVSDSGVIDAENANPSSSARDGNGSCIRCFENGMISAVGADASGSGASAIRVTGGGTVNAQGADLTSATTQTVWAENGGQALCENATVDADATFLLESGALCTIYGGTGATSATLGIGSGARYINPAGSVTTDGIHTFENGVKFQAGGGTLTRFTGETPWTPTLTTTGTDFDSVTMDAECAYSRVGPIVFIFGSIRTDAITKGAASGDIEVSGLPFDGSDGTLNRGALTIGFSANFLANHPTTGYFRDNVDRFTLGFNSSSGFTALTVADVDTGINDNWFMFSGFYFTDE